MQAITWNKNSYLIGDEETFLISGEFHYFRVPYHDWERRLRMFKEGGGNCAATYIPWVLHEPEEGTFCFSDCPERDFEGFVQLCAKVGLYVIARPGPYQYSEMKYCGLPDWLPEKYPEVLSENIEGQHYNSSSVSYMHPMFLKKTRLWFEKICPIIARYTISNGGPIAFVQIDNELMGIHYWRTENYDCNTVTMGFGTEDGRYPAFLRNKYKSIEKLSALYDTNYTSFSQVRPISGKASSIYTARRLKDYQDFYFGTCAEYCEILYKWIREFKIDTPVVHNSPNPTSNSTFLEVVDALDDGFLLGSDHYYNLSFNWKQNNPTPLYAQSCFYSNEMLRLMGYPPTVFELPGGSLSNWPPILPEDLQCAYELNTALGMKGFNYYIFTGGKNPFDIGSTGPLYDYSAAISAEGEVRQIYYVQKRFHQFLWQNKWLSRSKLASDFRIGMDWEATRSAYYAWGNYTSEAAWNFAKDGLILTAMCNSLTPEFADLGAAIEVDNKPLYVACGETMSAAMQVNIVDYVKRGGKLILGPVIPQYDEDYNLCTILTDYLECKPPEKPKGEAPLITVGNMRDMPGTVANLKEMTSVPKRAVAFAKNEKSGNNIGWYKDFQGGGRVVWLGYSWSYQFNYHADILRYLLQLCGCTESSIECDDRNVWTVLQRDGNNGMIFVMNLYSSPLETSVFFKTNEGCKINAGRYRLNPMQVLKLRADLLSGSYTALEN